MTEKDVAKLLLILRAKCPDGYRHIIGVIKVMLEMDEVLKRPQTA